MFYRKNDNMSITEYYLIREYLEINIKYFYYLLLINAFLKILFQSQDFQSESEEFQNQLITCRGQ